MNDFTFAAYATRHTLHFHQRASRQLRDAIGWQIAIGRAIIEVSSSEAAVAAAAQEHTHMFTENSYKSVLMHLLT